MADVWYDDQGQAWETNFGPTGTYIEGHHWNTRRKDLDIPKIAPPPAPPDLTDELVQRAGIAQRLRNMASQGIGSTFLTGPVGLTTPAPTTLPGLGGA